MTAPDFRAPTNKGHTLSPETFADRLAVVLVFLDPPDSADHSSMLWAFDAALPDFGARRVQLLGVVTMAPRSLRDETGGGALTLLADEDGSIRTAFGVETTSPAAVVIDRHGVVAAVLSGTDARRPAEVLEVVDGLLAHQPDAVEVHPSNEGSAGDPDSR